MKLAAGVYLNILPLNNATDPALVGTLVKTEYTRESPSTSEAAETVISLTASSLLSAIIWSPAETGASFTGLTVIVIVDMFESTPFAVTL